MGRRMHPDSVRILDALKSGPATIAEVARITGLDDSRVAGRLGDLVKKGNAVSLGRTESTHRGPGRAIYAVAGTPKLEPYKAKQEACADVPETVIAGGEYALATSRTFANYVFPGKGSRRGL